MGPNTFVVESNLVPASIYQHVVKLEHIGKVAPPSFSQTVHAHDNVHETLRFPVATKVSAHLGRIVIMTGIVHCECLSNCHRWHFDRLPRRSSCLAWVLVSRSAAVITRLYWKYLKC